MLRHMIRSCLLEDDDEGLPTLNVNVFAKKKHLSQRALYGTRVDKAYRFRSLLT